MSGEEVPVVNEVSLRENPDSNKFIQLNVDRNPYFRFIRPSDVRYHFDILANTLLEEFGIIPEFDGKGIPNKLGERYDLVGAGKFSKENKKIYLYGISEDYFVGPNKEPAEEISKLSGLEFIIK